jgi:hypothetical protein
MTKLALSKLIKGSTKNLEIIKDYCEKIAEERAKK